MACCLAQDDEGVLGRLRALVAAGGDPSVEGLVKCTGALLPTLLWLRT